MGRESNLRERGAMGTPKSKQLLVGGTQCKREENCREASGDAKLIFKKNMRGLLLLS